MTKWPNDTSLSLSSTQLHYRSRLQIQNSGLVCGSVSCHIGQDNGHTQAPDLGPPLLIGSLPQSSYWWTQPSASATLTLTGLTAPGGCLYLPEHWKGLLLGSDTMDLALSRANQHQRNLSQDLNDKACMFLQYRP